MAIKMYFGGSVIGKAASTIVYPPLPSPNFHRGQKVRNFASFETSLNFEPTAFENAAKCPKSEANLLCREAISSRKKIYV